MNGLAAFLNYYPVRWHHKGDQILRQDDTPKAAYLIKRGLVKSYNLTAKGEEKLITLHAWHDIFPIGWVLGSIDRTQYFYEAIDDVELYRIPRGELLAFLRNNSETMFQLLQGTVIGTLHDHLRLNALTQSKAFEKICSTMQYLALKFGHDIKEHVVEVDVPLTQQDVANFTGLTRETVSSELKKLTEQQVIVQGVRGYIIHTDRLNKLIDDEFEYGFMR